MIDFSKFNKIYQNIAWKNILMFVIYSEKNLQTQNVRLDVFLHSSLDQFRHEHNFHRLNRGSHLRIRRGQCALVCLQILYISYVCWLSSLYRVGSRSQFDATDFWPLLIREDFNLILKTWFQLSVVGVNLIYNILTHTYLTTKIIYTT